MSKGLEALNSLKISCRQNMDTIPYRNNKWRFKTIEKELRALEVIKKKMFNGKDDLVVLGDIYLTQEEFDLLKEVLL